MLWFSAERRLRTSFVCIVSTSLITLQLCLSPSLPTINASPNENGTASGVYSIVLPTRSAIPVLPSTETPYHQQARHR